MHTSHTLNSGRPHFTNDLVTGVWKVSTDVTVMRQILHYCSIETRQNVIAHTTYYQITYETIAKSTRNSKNDVLIKIIIVTNKSSDQNERNLNFQINNLFLQLRNYITNILRFKKKTRIVCQLYFLKKTHKILKIKS